MKITSEKEKREIITIMTIELEKRRVQVRVSATPKFTEFTSCAESEIAKIHVRVLRRQLE